MKEFYEIDGWFGYDHSKIYDYLVENTTSGGSFLELGAWLGRSTAYLIDNAPNLNITVIDSWEGSDSELDTNHKLAKTKDIFSMFKKNMGNRKFKFYKGRAEKLVEKFDNEYFDTIFIDMDHSYESVKRDIELWLPKVKKGGLLAGDDYRATVPGVIEAVKELLPNSLIYHYGWIYRNN